MKNQTLSFFAADRLGLVALAILTLALIGAAHVGSAQMGSGSPPPTYDYNDMVPGVQGPTSPSVAGTEHRALRPFSINVPVLVPLAELQAALPPGFNATANPAGSNTGQVTLSFFFQERTTTVADGRTFGPNSGLAFASTVMNTNLMPNRQETGLLVQEFSSQELVDITNAVFGPGSARLAKVNVQIAEDGGNLSYKFNVTDDGIGLNVSL